MPSLRFEKLSCLLWTVVFLLISTAFTNQGDRVAPEAQVIVYQEDFQDNVAQGWRLEPGWGILQEGDNYYLAGHGHAWADAKRSFDGDMRLSFRVRIQQGRIHLVTRLTDTGRYFIGFDTSGSDLNKQYFPDDFRNSIAGGGGTHSPDSWYQVEIILQGNRIEFLVDGVLQWSYTDSEPLKGGSFAFETLENSQADIDDIRVETWTEAESVPTFTQASTSAPTSAPAVSLTWQWLGGPLGGLGYDIRMRPGTPDTLYVSDAWAGVFMSTDGGTTWFPSNQGITTRTGPSSDAIPVFSLTIDPTNPDTLWIGTQFQRGIFKSTDGGQTWHLMVSGITETDGITFRGFAVDPTNSNVVYAAAEISSWTWSSDHRSHPGREFDMTAGVIYKTTDGGQYWKAVWRGDNLARYIWISPQDTNILYISTGFFDREAANSDPVAGTPGGEGILKSTNGGQTWTGVNNGLGNLYVTSLFMHPTKPEILFAATGNIQYRDNGGIYRTMDGGDTWSRVLSGDTGSIFEAVEVSTYNPDIVYAGNDQAIYRSQDGGSTWEKVSGGAYWGPAGVRAGFPVDFQVDPRDPERIFANEYGGGNFLSEDGGRNWVDASHGYTGAQVRDVTVDPLQPGRLFVAARSGIFISYNGGDYWDGLNYPPAVSMEWNVVAIDPDAPQHILAATNWNGLLESHTGGSQWTLVAPEPSSRIGWRAIAFAPSDTQTVYAGSAGFFSAGIFDPWVPGSGIYVSHDGGGTWNPANDSLTADAHVTALAVHPADPHTVFAATTNHGLVESVDGGQTWSQVAGGIFDSRIVLSVAIQPSNSAILFVGLDSNAVYRSTDGGATWTQSAYGLSPEASISDIVFNPVVPGEMYLADLRSGVYRSTDGGGHWLSISTGLMSRTVNSLVLSSDGLHLYAASEGMGAFRLDMGGQPPPAAPPPVSTPTPAALRTPTLTPAALRTSTPTSSKDAPGKICSGSAMILLLSALALALWRGRHS